MSKKALCEFFCQRDSYVTIKDVVFVPSGYPNRWNAIIDGQNASDSIHLIITGQRLLREGGAVDPYTDLNEASAYPDKRHLIQNPYPKMTNLQTNEPVLDKNGKPVYKDFGLDQIMDDRDKYQHALQGNKVELSFRMKDVDGTTYTVKPEDLSQGLEDKGYCILDSVNEVNKRGDCYLDKSANKLHIIFKQNAYPHHFIALKKDENKVLFDGVIGGWSNNGGTNPYDLAVDLQRSGFYDAILLDNGGDCVLCHRSDPNFPDPKEATIPSCERREEWAGVILYHTLNDAEVDAAITLAKASCQEEDDPFRFTV